MIRSSPSSRSVATSATWLDEVELGEARELVVRQPKLGGEEAKVDGARAQAIEVVDEPRLVVRPDGAQVDRAAVAEDGIPREFAWLAHPDTRRAIRVYRGDIDQPEAFGFGMS